MNVEMADPIQSMSYPQELFGYTAHALCVPPFPPADVLMIGYGQGTIAELIKLIWGTQVEIMGVDLVRAETNGYNDFWEGDASKFVNKYCTKRYDFVVVDLYNGKYIPTFVFSEQFVEGLARIARKLLAINCTFYDWNDFKIYDKHFLVDCVKQTNHDKVLFFNPKVEVERGKEAQA